jgi:hypothetical protein
MKKWVAALAISAGCQGSPASVTSQEVSADECHGVANFCGAKMPPSSSWIEGDPLPPLTPATVVLIHRASSSVWEAYGADPELGEVRWYVRMKPGAIDRFLDLVASSNHAFGGVRPPGSPRCPPICVDPGYLLSAALRMVKIDEQAAADAAACAP